MKFMKIVAGNTRHNDKESRGDKIQAILKEKENGAIVDSILVRNSEYDTESEKHKEIAPHVSLVYKGTQVFSGEFSRLAEMALAYKERLEPSNVSSIMTDYLNSYASYSIKRFVEAMAKEHRFLQAAFTRLCFAWIKHNADLTECEYDGRNSMEVKACTMIVENNRDFF